LPTGIAVDGNTENDYFYVNYLDNGPDAKVRGEITVYSMRDGRKVGWIIPGDETNHFSGATDLLVSMQVSKRSDGTRVITMEENGGAKFMVYHWKP